MSDPVAPTAMPDALDWRYQLLRPMLFRLAPEQAHELTLKLLAVAPISHWVGARARAANAKAEPVELLGLSLPNRVGLAAGLDKNGECIDGLAALGFGHVEVGTVTPRPQAGNPKPRLFRLPGYGALLNRMGFNNQGIDALIANVQKRRSNVVLGINIGKNANTPNEQAHQDYLHCLNRAWVHADYITVNVSSPNTQGLRDLQHGDALRTLLDTLRNAQQSLATEHGMHRPILIKIAPDLDDQSLAQFARVANEFEIEGVIATNTTQARDAIKGHPLEHEAGGLSGAVLTELAQQRLAALKPQLSSKTVLIGVGGIDSGAKAKARIEAGAELIQLYSGLIYRGPELLAEVISDCTCSAAERASAGNA